MPPEPFITLNWREALSGMTARLGVGVPGAKLSVDAVGRLWSDGYIDEPVRLDSGTVSIWRDTAAATAFAYSPGVHQEAVKAQRQGAWFPESWFGRFAIEAAEGSWRGLPIL